MPEANLILEEVNIAVGVVPVNLATAANNGDWISMKTGMRLVALLVKGAGAAGEPPTLKLQQATDVAGTGAKDLLFTTIYHKQGADITLLTKWTKVTQAAATSYALAAGDTQALVAVEIEAGLLDKAGGFDCVQASVADVGSTSQIGAILYLLGDLRFEAAPENLQDPLVN